MKFKKLLAMAGTAIMSSMALTAPVLAASVTQLQNVYDMVSVEDSTLDFPLFVYGASASIEDFVTATEAAAKFQTFAVIEEEVQVAGAEEVVTGGVKFRQPGDELQTEEVLTDVLDSVGEDDMDILASSTFVTEEGSSYEYNQYIDFGTDLSVEWYYGEDTDNDPEFMLVGEDGDEMYTYSLEFPESVTFDDATEELQGASIDWLGQTWTILDVTQNASDMIESMELISGKSVETVILNTPKTFGTNGDTYTVELVAVNTAGDEATLKIDDVLYKVDEGVTKTLPDGTSVTVTDVFAASKESTPDSCKVYIGARKVVLTDGLEMEVDDDDVDGATVTINTAAEEISGWQIEVLLEDDLFLRDGDEYLDVIAEAFSVQYTGYLPTAEEDWTQIKIAPSGKERIEMSFVNKDGDKINVPLAYDNATDDLLWGYSSTKPLILDETDTLDEDYYFFVSSTDGYYTHLLQVDKIETGDYVRFDNIGTGNTITVNIDSDYGTLRLNNQVYGVYEDSGDVQVDMTGDNTVDNVTTWDDTFMVGDDGYVFTEYGLFSAAIQFDDSTGNQCDGSNCTAGLVDITQAEDEDGNYDHIYVELGFEGDGDSSDNAIVDEPTTGDGYTFSFNDGGLLEVTDDMSAGVTLYGSMIEYDTDNDDVEIMYPGYQLYHSVYVGDAISVSAAAGGSVTTETFLQPTDFSRLDTQVTETDKMNRDMVLWGGPCVNTLVAGLEGMPYTCDTWPGENFGWLGLFSGAYAEGKTVLVAAGTRAVDTQLVGDVLSDGTKLEGVTSSSAKITGTAVSNVVIE